MKETHDYDSTYGSVWDPLYASGVPLVHERDRSLNIQSYNTLRNNALIDMSSFRRPELNYESITFPKEDPPLNGECSETRRDVNNSQNSSSSE